MSYNDVYFILVVVFAFLFASVVGVVFYVGNSNFEQQNIIENNSTFKFHTDVNVYQSVNGSFILLPGNLTDSYIVFEHGKPAKLIQVFKNAKGTLTVTFNFSDQKLYESLNFTASDKGVYSFVDSLEIKP